MHSVSHSRPEMPANMSHSRLENKFSGRLRQIPGLGSPEMQKAMTGLNPILEDKVSLFLPVFGPYGT